MPHTQWPEVSTVLKVLQAVLWTKAGRASFAQTLGMKTNTGMLTNYAKRIVPFEKIWGTTCWFFILQEARSGASSFVLCNHTTTRALDNSRLMHFPCRQSLEGALNRVLQDPSNLHPMGAEAPASHRCLFCQSWKVSTCPNMAGSSDLSLFLNQ